MVKRLLDFARNDREGARNDKENSVCKRGGHQFSAERMSISSVLNQTNSFPILDLVRRPRASRSGRYFLAVLTLLIFSETRFFGRM